MVNAVAGSNTGDILEAQDFIDVCAQNKIRAEIISEGKRSFEVGSP